MNHFFRSFCGSALLVLLLVEPLSAANIQYTLTLDGTPAGGTFTLEMDELDGPGDNAGIASYTATLSGGLTDIQHVSPNGNVFDLPAFEPRGPVGFTLFRTADGAVDNVAPGVTRVAGHGHPDRPHRPERRSSAGRPEQLLGVRWRHRC